MDDDQVKAPQLTSSFKLPVSHLVLNLLKSFRVLVFESFRVLIVQSFNLLEFQLFQWVDPS